MATWTIDNNVLSITGAEGLLGTRDNNALVIETNGSTRLWINPSGNVGVGTSAPSSQLHVNVAASTNPISALTIDVESFRTVANSLASHFLLVRDIDAAPPDGATHLAVRGDGFVGIGTPTPSARLSVVLHNTTEVGRTAHSTTLLTSRCTWTGGGE